MLLTRITGRGWIKEHHWDVTRIEIQNLIAAVTQYEIAYSHFPGPSNVIESDLIDFTFGTYGTSKASLGITNASGYQANNSELMAILTDNPNTVANTNHCRNPQRLVLYSARIAPDTNSPGLGPDGVLRDRWGNPYIISIHLKEDETCRDAFYSLPSVSGTNPPRVRARVMIWSLGPDGKADRTKSADAGVNKDNILSWSN